MKVLSPPGLASKFEPYSIIQTELQNLGNVVQGTTWNGQIVVPTHDPQLCTLDESMTPKNDIFFFLVQRGGCSFTQKQRNAARVSAAAVFVADFEKGDAAYDSSTSKDLLYDGTLQMHIPIFEISFESANKIIQTIEQDKSDVFVQVKANEAYEKDHVEVDLWYASVLDLGLKLADELAALSYSFREDHSAKPLFTPRVATFACPECDEQFKTENCVSDGMFCAYTPKFFDEYRERNPDFELTGRDILVQALYEKCLHQIMSDKYKDEGSLFWTFFSYLDVCFVEDAVPVTNLDECFDWSTVEINGNEEVQTVDECVEGSFETFGDYATPNRILQ